MKRCVVSRLLVLPHALARLPWVPRLASSEGLESRMGVRDLDNPYNVSIRYKETAICETTPGVKSYSGYIDVGQGSHTFFWFFEAREHPQTAPITLWLNGGPGSDSLVGLFQEIGPCSVNPDLTTVLNPFSWSQASNLLFLSQPPGVGFSYAEGFLNATDTDTAEKAARSAWHVLQGFITNIRSQGTRLDTRNFHLWTESYGGHYGPVFGKYFDAQNSKIKTGDIPGVPLRLATIGIGNGIIDATAQFPSYANFAMNNTYGIKCVSDDIYTHMNFSCYMRNGCLDQISRCRQALKYDGEGIETTAACVEAANMCRDNVEGPYYEYSGRNMYDIRRSSEDQLVSDFFVRYLNLPATQQALGVERGFMYQMSSNQVYSAFQQSGDYVSGEPLESLGYLLDRGIRIVLMYGDADYIGNWIGGEVVSLKINHTAESQFRNAPYRPFVYNGAQFGRAREYGNLSFVIVSDAGHLVPLDKPDASLELFRRAITGVDIASGQTIVASQTTIPFIPDPPVATTSRRPTSTPTPGW